MCDADLFSSSSSEFTPLFAVQFEFSVESWLFSPYEWRIIKYFSHYICVSSKYKYKWNFVKLEQTIVGRTIHDLSKKDPEKHAGTCSSPLFRIKFRARFLTRVQPPTHLLLLTLLFILSRCTLRGVYMRNRAPWQSLATSLWSVASAVTQEHPAVNIVEMGGELCVAI